MITLFSSNYMARKPIEKAMIGFAKNFSKENRILDIGCGNKPYAKYFSCKYTGLDPYKEVCPDIIADAWSIPLPDNSFDGIILNQSLEHIARIEKTIGEIERLLKPGGLCIITAPQTVKVHSVPVPINDANLEFKNNLAEVNLTYWHNDYYRFTKYGLLYLFRDFKIVSIKETNGYFGTILQLINYFFTSLKIKFIFLPIYFINNVFGIFLDRFFASLDILNIKIINKFNTLIYKSLTLNYILIAKKKSKE